MLKKLIIVSMTCGLALWPPAQAKETLIFAHLYSESSLQQQALREADQELIARSGGELRLDIRPHGRMGDRDNRMVDAVDFGQADMTFVGGSFAARDYPPIGVISAPFAFRDFTHWRHFRASPLANELAIEYEKASGMAVLGYYYYGTRHLNSRMPIKRPEDLIGLKIRVPDAPIFLKLFRSLGAAAIPMPFWQTYEAITQGTVDAEENPLPTIKDGNLFQVAPYVSLSAHMTETAMIVINAKRLTHLSDDQQKLVHDVFAEVADRLTERVRTEEIDIMEQLKTRGVTFIVIDRDALAAKAMPLVTATGFAWSGELYNRLKSIP
jgi:tripartite ATP-independent transporter DctP family solute receptor